MNEDRANRIVPQQMMGRQRAGEIFMKFYAFDRPLSVAALIESRVKLVIYESRAAPRRQRPTDWTINPA